MIDRFPRFTACLATFGILSLPALAQPTFESASPTAGGSTSQQANQMADKAMYKEVEYKNIAKKGPMLVVIPGEVKSNNATFTQRFGPNNIADFAELAHKNQLQVLDAFGLQDGQVRRWLPNWRAGTAVFKLQRR